MTTVRRTRAARQAAPGRQRRTQHAHERLKLLDLLETAAVHLNAGMSPGTDLLVVPGLTASEVSPLWKAWQCGPERFESHVLSLLGDAHPHGYAVRKTTPPFHLRSRTPEERRQLDAAAYAGAPTIRESYYSVAEPAERREVEAIKSPHADALLALLDAVRGPRDVGQLHLFGALRRCGRCDRFYVERANLKRGRFCTECTPSARREAAARRKARSRRRGESSA